jgi:serine/threonine protein kinase
LCGLPESCHRLNRTVSKQLTCEMSLKDYLIEPDPIGRGQFGVVQKAVRRSDKAEFAIKRIKSAAGGALSQAEEAKNRREVELLKKFRHANVVYPIDAFVDADTGEYCIVQELCDGGELPSYLELLDEKRLPLAEQLPCAVCLIGALAYLHERDVMHRDLKPANILVKGGVPKLADFGEAIDVHKHRQRATNTYVGSPAFMAPEVLALEGVREAGGEGGGGGGGAAGQRCDVEAGSIASLCLQA